MTPALPVPAAPLRLRLHGATTPAGAALLRALGPRARAEAGPGPADLLVEAGPVARLGPVLEPPSPVALAEALAPLADLGAQAAQVERGGLVLLVSAWAPGSPRGWLAPLLAARRAWVEEAARELAARGVRAAGIMGPVAARLPGFLQGGAGPSGVTPDEVARAALWLLDSPSAAGRTLELG